MKTNKIRIVNVTKNNQRFIEVVADWLWSEWGMENNYAYWKSWVASSTFIDKIPQTLAAINGDEIVGTVSLWRCDLQSRQDIFPWLGGLFVKEDYRLKGIGAELQEYSFRVVNNLGYKEIYMFTELNGYFEKFGWNYLENVPDENGKMVKLYRKDL
jgi:GNAT superfamily N-acetyltransferase